MKIISLKSIQKFTAISLIFLLFLVNYSFESEVPDPDIPKIDSHKMTVDVGGWIREDVENQIYVKYCNAGATDATNAYVEVALDTAITFVSSLLPWTYLGGNAFSFEVGDVEFNSCDYFRITTALPCNTMIGQTHCIAAHIFPDARCLPSSPIGDEDLDVRSELASTNLANKGRLTETPSAFSEGFITAFANSNNLDFSVVQCLEVLEPADFMDEQVEPSVLVDSSH